MCVAGAPQRVLVVDDDTELLATVRELLERQGYAVDTTSQPGEALRLQQEGPRLSLALVDLVMPGCDGLALMEQLRSADPKLPVILMTGFATIESAVDAIKRGAEDYLTKPFTADDVRKKVGRLLELDQLRDRVARLEENLREARDPFQPIIYVSAQMAKVVERARAVAASEASVLLLGETGTGKEMLARAIHQSSTRATGPFIALNCGAIPAELVESELFGAKRGAFTGAYADKPGTFVAARGGTVFLDEIGEMPKEAQVKLLRVLQSREVQPLGASNSVAINVRVVSATNRPLQDLRQNALREDLYFRLCTVVIEVPPLRARREDVLVLAQYLAARLADRYGRHITLGRGAAELLLQHSFPGNVRELENLLEGVCATSTADPQVIENVDLRPQLEQTARSTSGMASEGGLSLESMERVMIERALRVCGGNRTRAASLLGISRDTLYRKLREYDLATEAGAPR